MTTLMTTYLTVHLYELAAPSHWLEYYPDTATAEQPPETEDIHSGNDPHTCSHSRFDPILVIVHFYAGFSILQPTALHSWVSQDTLMH